MKDWRIETKTIQEGYKPKNGEPRVLPIYQSTTYKYESTTQVADLFDLKVPGHMYSRISNPTVEALENKIAALEGGVAALCTSSGQSAIMVAVLNLCEAGDHIISINKVYGGTYNLFSTTLKKMGIEVTFVDANITKEEVEGYIKENTKLIYGETIANPALAILDIEYWANIAHKNKLPLIVDNTFATPFLCRPFEFGADVVVHSTTKYMDGHATSVGGVIVSSGKFDFGNGKFPGFITPDESYHGLTYSTSFKEAAYIAKARVQFIRDMGNYMNPQNAFLTNLGLETLHLRMERHSENALSVARFLEESEYIQSVNYPGLESNAEYEKSLKYLPKGCSGVVSFEMKGDIDTAINFMDALKLAAIVVHVADARTSVIHPASSTHRQMNEEEQKACGVMPTTIRISVGLENIQDILEDLQQALEGAMK